MQSDGNLVLYRGGRARWSTGTNGQNVDRLVMQGDGNFVLYGPGGALWSSGTDNNPGASLLVQDDGNVVIYAPGGNPLWATDTNVPTVQVPGFLPSTAGFKFSNSDFPVGTPDVTIDVFGQRITIGDASNGLCGGMVFAALDYFYAGMPIPAMTVNPTSGQLFDYIVKRLVDSFDILLPPPPPFLTPAPPFGPGPLTYLHLMNPDLPDHETWFSTIGLAYHGRSWVMVAEQWPGTKSDLDSGRLSPIALVEVKSGDVTRLGDNHQVLAYGYDIYGMDVTIRIYDPNYPGKDNVTLSFSIAEPSHTTSITHSHGASVVCYFRQAYGFSPPPGGF